MNSLKKYKQTNRELTDDLLVEQLKRLAKTGGCSATTLWENITVLMTDYVSKKKGRNIRDHN